MERQYDDYLGEGLSPAEARRRVGLEFGSIELAKDECRDIRPWHWLGTTARDVRLGLRGLARERLFTLSVTLILTIGIGAMAIVLSAQGLQQGFMLMTGAEFVDTTVSMRPYWWIRTLTGISMDVGMSLLVINLMRTSRVPRRLP